ncbi:MAG: hypothetical protein DI539_18815 [Flavobacterium psychrophilum]|nr:MAG: hypothetical protein DI539_18815 [Flavobacterium psychrophilum]
MKKSIFMLSAMLVFGIASAQVNKVDPVTTMPSPGTPPTVNATQQINRDAAKKVNPSMANGPVTSTSPSTEISKPVPIANPLNGTDSPYPGKTLAYPQPQGALQPGTAITTEQPTGTNNQVNILPGSNTTNQGKVP